MKRILLVMTVALVMAAMVVAMAMPAFADPDCTGDPDGVRGPAHTTGNLIWPTSWTTRTAELPFRITCRCGNRLRRLGGAVSSTCCVFASLRHHEARLLDRTRLTT